MNNKLEFFPLILFDTLVFTIVDEELNFYYAYLSIIKVGILEIQNN